MPNIKKRDNVAKCGAIFFKKEYFEILDLSHLVIHPWVFTVNNENILIYPETKLKMM